MEENKMNNDVNIQNQGQEVGKNYDINYDKANDVNYVTPNIVKGNDGVYRWMYEIPILKNPTMLITLIKFTVGICVFLFIFLAIFSKDIVYVLKLVGIGFACVMVLIVIGYLIYVAIMGGKYIACFQMDEDGITHTHMPKQANRIKAIANVAMIVGFLDDDMTLMNSGYMADAKSETTSKFINVKSIKIKRGKDMITLTNFPSKNPIYVKSEDFDFVENFIRSHCANAKAKM